MSQLVAFYHIDTEAEFLLKTVLSDSSSITIGNFNPVNGGLTNRKQDGTKPDIPWNSLVFIKDKGSIYYNRKYYGHDLYNLNNLIFKSPVNNTDVYVTGYKTLIVGNGDSDALTSNLNLQKLIIDDGTTAVCNELIVLIDNIKGTIPYINCRLMLNSPEVSICGRNVIFSDSSILMHGVGATFDVSAMWGNIRTSLALSLSSNTGLNIKSNSMDISCNGVIIRTDPNLALSLHNGTSYITMRHTSIDCSTVSFGVNSQSTIHFTTPSAPILFKSSDTSVYLLCILTSNGPQVSLLDECYRFNYTGITSNKNIIVQSRSLMEYTAKVVSILSTYINNYVRILDMQSTLHIVYKGEIIIHISGMFIKYEWRKLGTSLNYYMKMTLSDTNIINDIIINTTNGCLNVYLKFMGVYALPYRIEYFSDITDTNVASPVIVTVNPTGFPLSSEIKKDLASMNSAVMEGINHITSIIK